MCGRRERPARKNEEVERGSHFVYLLFLRQGVWMDKCEPASASLEMGSHLGACEEDKGGLGGRR